MTSNETIEVLVELALDDREQDFWDLGAACAVDKHRLDVIWRVTRPEPHC